MKYFYFSHAFTIIGMVLAYLWRGWEGVAIAALLTIMEISLSFDNAVINATVLKKMSEVWQKRFLTWGILIAVFGMRLVFPVLIVALATGLGLWDVANLAFTQPEVYSQHVLDAHVSIASFGGMFLLMVFLHFICNAAKDVHWIGWLESRLSSLGKLESVEVVIALTILLALQSLLPAEIHAESLFAGVVGVASYVFVHSLTGLMGASEETQEAATRGVASAGFLGFMYLQLLDASFSLDGVIGAFAMSNDVVIIMLGLGIGAMFVRSLTVYLVRKGTLDEYVYLEHGAHYGIGALAFIMLFSMKMHVPEVITGLVGVGLIGLSLFSSLRLKRKGG